jgi:hypothetical protein
MKKLLILFLFISQLLSAQSTYFIEPDRYRVLKIRMKNPTNLTTARVYWATDLNPDFGPGRSIEFSISAKDESFKVYHINLYKHSGWGDRQITKMKIDNASGTLKDRLEFEFIHLKETNLFFQDLRFSRQEDGFPNSHQRKYYEPELMAQWQETRKAVDEILASDRRVPGLHFGNLLNKEGISAAINIPPLDPLSEIQKSIEEFVNTGVKLESINLQSTLSKPIDGISPMENEAEMQKRYDYVINVVKWMWVNYPDVKVGITCALLTKNHDYKKYYTELKDQLIAAGDYKIDFIELDHAQNYTDDAVGAGLGYHNRFWGSMKEYELFLHNEMKVKFYAVIGFRYAKTAKDYHNYTLQVPQLFRDYNVKCDGYNVQYWWDYPDREIPESDPNIHSACRTILGIFEDITYPHISKIMENSICLPEEKHWHMSIFGGWNTTPSAGIGNLSVNNGILSYNVLNNDPHIMSASELGYCVTNNPHVMIRVKNITPGTLGRIYFKTNGDESWVGNFVSQSISANDTDFKEYIFDMSSHTGWTGTLNQLRVDIPNDAGNGSVEIDYIKLGNFLLETSDVSITPFTQVNGGTWTQTNTATLCAGGTVSFGPHPNVETGWAWTGPNGFTASTRQISFAAIAANRAGNYVATYTDGNGNKGTKTFTITVNSLPIITPNLFLNNTWQTISSASYSVGQTVEFGPWPLVETGWTWTGPNAYTSNVRGSKISNIQLNQKGIYTAKFTDNNGCSSVQNFNITVSTVTGLENAESSNLITIYPNPVHNVLNVFLKNSTDNQTMYLLNSVGQVVLSKAIEVPETTINTEGLSSGVYLLKVGDSVHKVVINK